MNFSLLGVRIDQITLEQAKQKVRDFLLVNEHHSIFTPNPEMLVDSQKDEDFKRILNSSSLNICDGRGVELVSRGKVVRIPGVDFFLEIAKIAEEMGKSVYLLGSGDDEVAKRMVDELTKLFPRLKIVGVNKGPKIKRIKDYKIEIDNDENERIIDNIIQTAPDILFVAFGHSKQEKWISQFLPDLPSVKIAIGVGGSFDYISGKVKRAPMWMRKIGLEWLYRLVKEPKRIKRIWKATVTFLGLFIYGKN